MWHLFSTPKKHLIISLTPEQLVCSIISVTNNHCNLVQYKRTPLFMQCLQGTLFDYSFLHQTINRFVTQYNARNIPAVIGISGPTVKEEIVYTTSSTPARAQLETTALRACVWHAHYICPHENGQSLFYVAGITRHHLCSYQLLGATLGLNVLAIEPLNYALLHVYRHIQKDAFRTSKLSHDLIHNSLDMTKLTSPETARRLLAPGCAIPLSEYAHVTPLIGLFLSQGTV
jgi:hypothetical protein